LTPSHRFELILALMAAVLLLEFAARKLRLPPSAALVLGGIGLALIPGVPDFELDPDLTLLLFLPPLLFESAYFTAWRDFRANLRIILQLAVGAVAFTTLIVGVVTHLVLPSLPWAACFALGAIVSPPDAVAAKAVLKGLPLPPRVTTLLEGESLVNDATGLVLFKFAIAAGLTGVFSAGAAVGNFLVLALGGIAAGLAFGYAVSFLLGRLRESHLTIVASFLAAWASYMLGDLLHVSGVLATVSGGLLMGWRQHDVVPAQTRIQAVAVWSVVVFALESLVFVFIGLSLRGVLGRLSATGVGIASLAPDIAYITGAMVLARFLWIFPATYVPRLAFPGLRRRDPYPPVAVPIVMSWAGMRGVVSLAVALSVPVGFPGRDFILATTLAVILISILVQGTTLVPLIRALRLSEFVLKRRASLSEAEARVEVALAALAALKQYSTGADGAERHPRLVEQYSRRAAMAAHFVDTQGQHADKRADHYAAILIANRSARNEVLSLHRAGKIHDSVLHSLEAELDLEEISAQRSMTGPKLD
jgi:CPA1 family monovalent cation:H+ antiporter